MRKLILLVMGILSSLLSPSIGAQETDLFTPVQGNNLRLPSVPLVSVDPYFSIWSPYDKLYQGSPTHWHNTPKPLNGVIRVDGKAYRFMGQTLETLAPMADETTWTGTYTTSNPSGTSWTTLDYDDSSWSVGKAAWGGNDDNYGNIGTTWEDVGGNIWVRRKVTLAEIDETANYYVTYKHDDTFELYVNGKQVVSTGYTWNVSGKTALIDRSLLHEGENIIAAHCANNAGGAYVDFGLAKDNFTTAVQKSCVVMPTSTYYTFTCGGVNLNVVFTTPLVMDDLDLFTTPLTYISYQAQSNDGNPHEVSILVESSAAMALSNNTQTAQTRYMTSTSYPGYKIVRAGNVSQSPLSHTGELIDWGYYYVSAQDEDGKRLSIMTHQDAISQFLATGQVEELRTARQNVGGPYHSIAYTDSLGQVGTQPVSSFLSLSYDDVFSIQFFSNNRKAYWTQNGKVTLGSRIMSLHSDYANIMERCRQMDEKVYNDAYNAGGEKYAEICCAVYRQVCAAHKLVSDAEGNLLYMSRENDSGGFINTLDVTYPSQPLYWVYSPTLAKAMITPILQYAYTGRWNKDWTAHDLGAYPKANGQTYGDGMPVEEAGNMLTLLTLITYLDGDLDYVRKYWTQLSRWTDYLYTNGKDPKNQLCTDDFMGTSERNANLAAKATLGVRSYAELASWLGLEDVAAEYKQKAEEMAAYWKENAYTSTGGIHYLLNFGASGSTWSTKYNLIWDQIWEWDLFKDVRTREMVFYRGKMNTYGLPLDSRGAGCKSDWVMWTAAMAPTALTFQQIMLPIWKYINETSSRVPVSDNHRSDSGNMWMFRARSVVGGYWMKCFVEKFKAGDLGTGISSPKTGNAFHNGEMRSQENIYDVSGRSIQEPLPGDIYIKDGQKVLNNQ